MAKDLLFQFWVKPQGILASKRYANVFVDRETGAVTQENVPGKEAINLNSLSDYKSNNYPYAEGQEITRFCNTTTFTQYRILAKRSKDWAITQTDLNAPICGYLEPLPTPAVPANPFGTATYGLYATLAYCDVKQVAYEARIFKRNHDDTPIEIQYGSSSPVRRIYTAGDDKFSTIRSQEVELSFIATSNFQLQNIYTADEREYRLDIYDVASGERNFSGFIMPDNSDEPFAHPNYTVTVRATDGIGALKTITYPMPVGSSTDIRQKFLYILAFALAKTNLDLDILTMVNIYATGMANGLNDDPLEQANVNPLRMSSTNGEIYSCYEAIDAVCREFGASISQVNGQWRIARITELATGTGRYRLYDYTGRFKFAGTLSTLRTLANSNSPDLVLEAGANSSIQPPYKMVRVLQEFGRAPDVIYNGNFEDWDGMNFRYWTRYGAINVTRVQKEIIASAGVKVPVDDYACRFNEKAVGNKWLEDSPTWINKGQTAKLSLNIGKTDGIYDFKVRFKIGQYYLTNFNGAFEWVTQLATTAIRIDNRTGDIFSFPISIEIPTIPISGDMVIQFYGFNKLQAVNSGSPPPNGARPARGSENGVGGTTITYYEVDDYTPIDIDNIAITTTVSDEKRTKGRLNTSQQLGIYTNKPDIIPIIWGEFITGGFDPVSVTGSYDPTRPPRGDVDLSTAPQRQLQTIYLSNGSAATGWYEYGSSGSPVLMGMALARAILRAYQEPYRLMTNVVIKGLSMNYFDTFNIIVPNEADFSARIFMWQNVEFNDKTNEASGDIVEIFSKSITSIDYSTPQIEGSNGGTLPIIQNPNPPIKISGIFTEQFTPEFT